MTKYTALALGALFSCAYATQFPAVLGRSSNKPKDAYINKLLSKAKTIRKLNQEAAPDISGYSLAFEQCQFMRQMSYEECDADAGTCLETKHLVIFKLCQNCGNCNYNYGEYMIDLEDYLEMTTAYYQEEQEQYCEACDEYCNADEEEQEEEQQEEEEEEEEQDEGEEEEEEGEEDNEDRRRKLAYNVDCDSCADECYAIENMEENGYIDAVNYLECAQLDADQNGNQYFAGPLCSNGGKSISIGVFKDEQCSVSAYVDIENYLVDGDGNALQLEETILQKTYTDTCISCTAVNWDEDEDANDDQNQEAEITEVCEELYENAAKCETDHGFDATYNWYDIYYNLAPQEETICNLISNLKNGVYSSDGEINLSTESRSVNGVATSSGQKAALAVFIVATIGLAIWAASLHSQLTKGSSELSQQGGAMA